MSKEVKGVLIEEVREAIAQWLEEKINVGSLLEPFDKMIFRLIINQVDNNFGEKIPEPYQSEIRDTLTLIFKEKDIDTAVTNVFEFLDSIIDIPLFDDESEKLIFEGLSTLVAGILAKLNVVKE